MIYQPKNPLGYQNLLTWKQAGEIYHKTKDFTSRYLDSMSDRRLIGHMDDSARSVQRNIEEGYKRASTKEYIEFLGFSRASLEELKGDFGELKREWEEKIRWDKGKEGYVREKVIGEIKGLLNLIYGEDCMMGRQIVSLEKKMVKDKTLPQNVMIKRAWESAASKEKKFWKVVKDKFGIEKDEKGIIRENKGKKG